MFLTILVRFLLVRVRQTPHRIDHLDLVHGRLITVVDPAATTRLIGILGLLFASGDIAGSWCPCKT